MKQQPNLQKKTNGGSHMSNLPVIGNYSETVAALQDVIAKGNLASLTDEGRLKYYAAVCDSSGLNPLTRPFEFIELKGKLVMYAKKDCTEQLRKIHGISCEKVEHRQENELYIVTVTVRDKTGRTDISTGAIPIKGAKGEDFANLIMKTETKAKRRATLSISGLGILDETELESIPNKNIISSAPEVKPEEYKITHEKISETAPVEICSKEQIEQVIKLCQILKKDPRYLPAALKARLGHEIIENAPAEFMDKWIAALQKNIEEVEQFKSELE